MIFPKLSSVKNGAKDHGLILFDAILALSLSAVFVALLAVISIQSGKIYENARNRSLLMAAYKLHADEFADLAPHETRSKSYSIGSSTDIVKIDAKAVWFGNDRVETDVAVSNQGRQIDFAAVRAYKLSSDDDSAGTPLCSVNFSQDSVVGSYRYFHPVLKVPPAAITPMTLPIDPLLPLTDLIVRNGAAYVSADSSIASDPDLLVADISDPSRPLILSSINTGPGLSAMALAGNYVFAAAVSTAAQLHVIRIDGPSSLYLAKKYRLPPPSASTSPPVGAAIFYDDKKVYLGTAKWDGQELAIIDVMNPESPVKISGYETDSKINAVHVFDDALYIGASDQDQFRIIDVKDPLMPTLMSSFGPSGWQRQEGRVIAHFENALGFGRTSGGFNIVGDKELFSGASTSSRLESESALDVPGGVYGIISDRGHVFAATRTLDREFSIFNRSLSTSSAVYYPLPVEPQTMTCDGDRLYILAKTAPVIYEIRFYAD